MEYIFDLQVYVVTCHVQYMTCYVRMGFYVEIYCSNVDVYLQSETDLVSVRGKNGYVSYFGIGSGFVTHISGSDCPIVSCLVDSLEFFCRDHRIFGSIFSMVS